MRISDLLKLECIELHGSPATKPEAIHQMVDLMVRGGNIADRKVYEAGVFERETEGTTGVGDGVAIPHCRSNVVTRPGLAAMVVPAGVEYEAMDDEPVHLIFLIAAPHTKENIHLDMLAALSRMLTEDAFRARLLAAKTPREFLDIIDAEETRRAALEQTKAAAQAVQSAQGGFRVLAVTACPTGIAHTYMAAEALEGKAKEMGLTLKVETDGSGGVKNALTPAEIAACECIIVAADKNVEMARFDGKPVILTKVANGISKPGELLTQAVGGKAAVYHAQGGERGESISTEKESVGRIIYKHLMNGVSHMLPFVIGGGILIALAFLFDGANAGTSAFGTGNALSLFLKTVGGYAFDMMYPILAGYIAMSIADRPGLMPGIVGGLIAKYGMSLQASDSWISSGFFGALIAGFAAGYIMLGLKKLFEKLPKALEGTKPVLLYPFFGILITGALMVLIVNPPVGAFNAALNTALTNMNNGSKILLGAVLGGMMSIDFGGPFNKAAYVFGTASITTAPEIMAAVMAGGMVPPIAIALACTFAKNRFTARERQTTVTNYIMGLSFITEGAIPFAASDPLRVIPSCIVGSALAGALSMAFGCTCPAPHGGIFIIGIITNPVMYLVAMVAGAVVSALLLTLLKKPLPAEQSGLNR